MASLSIGEFMLRKLSFYRWFVLFRVGSWFSFW